MGRINYTAYSFNRPSIPFSQSNYYALKRMDDAEFEKWLSATSSDLWKSFKENNTGLIKMVLGGGFGGLLIALLFAEWAEMLSLVGILAMGVAFFAGSSLLLSASSHTNYVRSLKKFYKYRRKLIVLSSTYEEYISREAESKK